MVSYKKKKIKVYCASNRWSIPKIPKAAICWAVHVSRRARKWTLQLLSHLYIVIIVVLLSLLTLHSICTMLTTPPLTSSPARTSPQSGSLQKLNMDSTANLANMTVKVPGIYRPPRNSTGVQKPYPVYGEYNGLQSTGVLGVIQVYSRPRKLCARGLYHGHMATMNTVSRTERVLIHAHGTG